MEYFQMPGAQGCVGCGGLTFRNRQDGLCPRCAYQAEHLIEQIEIDSLERDLSLLTRFEAYYRQREELRATGDPTAVPTPLGDPVPAAQVATDEPDSAAEAAASGVSGLPWHDVEPVSSTASPDAPAEDPQHDATILRFAGHGREFDRRPRPFGPLPPFWSQRRSA